ncbi:hypothetical protein K501DRAFT_277855 [Backusella circina FSU 941]|nr:hypothetical protein K501DRAFT_277855 [Backusella circina FSU 941]
MFIITLNIESLRYTTKSFINLELYYRSIIIFYLQKVINSVSSLFVPLIDYIYANEKVRQVIWETIFNLDHVQKKRITRELVRILVYSLNPFFRQLISDFKKSCTSPKKDGINKQKRQVDPSNLTHGIYPLNKQPTGIASDEKIIGIDPVVRDLVTCVAPSTEDNRYDKISISNASYKVRSGMPWLNAIELKKREEANIQDAYDKIPSLKSVHLVHVVTYIRAISECHNSIVFFFFMKGYQHRERQRYMYSDRKVALDFISNVVISKTTTEEPIMLVHTSYKSRRKKVRKKHRKKKQLHQLQNQKTVVAYGDANFLSIKGHSPAPVKKTLQAIAQKALVVLINEYKTSITCSNIFCQSEFRFTSLFYSYG